MFCQRVYSLRNVLSFEFAYNYSFSDTRRGIIRPLLQSYVKFSCPRKMDKRPFFEPFRQHKAGNLSRQHNKNSVEDKDSEMPLIAPRVFCGTV